MFSFPPRSDKLETPTSDEYGTLSRPTGPESQVDRLDTVLEALVLPTDDTEATQRSTAMFKLCRHVCRLLAAAQGLTASAIAMLFLGHAMTARPSFTSQALRHLPLLGLDPSPLFYTALLEAWSGRFRPRLADGTEVAYVSRSERICICVCPHLSAQSPAVCRLCRSGSVTLTKHWIAHSRSEPTWYCMRLWWPMPRQRHQLWQQMTHRPPCPQVRTDQYGKQWTALLQHKLISAPGPLLIAPASRSQLISGPCKRSFGCRARSLK